MPWDRFRLYKIRRRLSRSSLGRQLIARAKDDAVRIDFEDLDDHVAALYLEASSTIQLNENHSNTSLVRALAHELRHHEQQKAGLFSIRDALAPIDASMARRVCEADARTVEVLVCGELAAADPGPLNDLRLSRPDLSDVVAQGLTQSTQDLGQQIFRKVADPEPWRSRCDVAEIEARFSVDCSGWPTSTPAPLSAFLQQMQNMTVAGVPYLNGLDPVAAMTRDDDLSEGRMVLLGLEESAFGAVRSAVKPADVHAQAQATLKSLATTIIAQRIELHRSDRQLGVQAQALAAAIQGAKADRSAAGYERLSKQLDHGRAIAGRIRQLWLDKSLPEHYAAAHAHCETIEQIRPAFDRQSAAARAATELFERAGQFTRQADGVSISPGATTRSDGGRE